LNEKTRIRNIVKNLSKILYIRATYGDLLLLSPSL